VSPSSVFTPSAQPLVQRGSCTNPRPLVQRLVQEEIEAGERFLLVQCWCSLGAMHECELGAAWCRGSYEDPCTAPTGNRAASLSVCERRVWNPRSPSRASNKRVNDLRRGGVRRGANGCGIRAWKSPSLRAIR
jgi:hypothetical protein